VTDSLEVGGGWSIRYTPHFIARLPEGCAATLALLRVLGIGFARLNVDPGLQGYRSCLEDSKMGECEDFQSRQLAV